MRIDGNKFFCICHSIKSFDPLELLQCLHARIRLSAEFDPCLILGIIWSIDISALFPQYAHTSLYSIFTRSSSNNGPMFIVPFISPLYSLFLIMYDVRVYVVALLDTAAWAIARFA